MNILNEVKHKGLLTVCACPPKRILVLSLKERNMTIDKCVTLFPAKASAVTLFTVIAILLFARRVFSK